MPRKCNCCQKDETIDPVIRQGEAIIRSEIEQRINEYVYAIDAVFNAPNKTAEGLAIPLANYLSFFTDQVTWIADGTKLTTKEEIAQYLSKNAIDVVRYSLHSLVNPDIHVISPCQAVARARLLQYLRIQLGSVVSNVFMNLGNYQLDWVFEDCTWKITRFVFTTEQGGLGFVGITPSAV